MKYQQLINMINKIPFSRMHDGCNNIHDLWYVLEVPKVNKRLWIKHNFSKRWNISQCQLDLDVRSEAYQKTYNRKEFSNQKEMISFIEENFL